MEVWAILSILTFSSVSCKVHAFKKANSIAKLKDLHKSISECVCLHKIKCSTNMRATFVLTGLKAVMAEGV